MATITTNTYLDSGTARTAGETWNINNNATLTIRTDTRRHIGSPASMTGSIGSITCASTQGGKVEINATSIRWLPYTNGVGSVPPIGAIITQGGVSGYVLGIWANYTSAPANVASTAPTIGYIKFREVTGGSFAPGSLVYHDAMYDFTCDIAEADRAGWLEVVIDETATWNIGQLGEFSSRGDWFYNDVLTSGIAHQLIQWPTNGGAGSSDIFAIQIETGPGTGVYNWWHGLQTTSSYGDTVMTTAIIGTDGRNRYFQSNADGTSRLGGDGTNLIGYVPPAGCRIRIANIIFRACTTAARATNAFKYNVTTGPSLSAHTLRVDLQYCNFVMRSSSFGGTGTLVIDNCALYGQAGQFDNIRTSASVTNSSFSMMGASSSWTFKISNSMAPFYVSNIFVTDPRSISGGGQPGGLYKSSNITMSNIEWNMISTWYSEHYAMGFDGIRDSTVTNMSVTGNELLLVNSSNLTFTNVDYCVKVKGPLTATQSTHMQAIALYTCNNVLIDGLTFGKNGAYASLQPYGEVILIGGTMGPVTIRNLGTRLAPLPAGANASYYSNVLAQIQPGSPDVKFQRCYLTNYRSGAQMINFQAAASATNTIIDNVMCLNYAKPTTFTGKDPIVRGISGPVDTVADGFYGGHYCDYFTSDTTGALVWYGMQPSPSTSGENYIVSPTSMSKYLAPVATVLLGASGDYSYSEITYFIKGHTAFRNTAPVITGSNKSSATYEYQLDTGTGWSGTWKILNTTNLLAETISPTGFKIKLKFTSTNSITPPSIQSVQIMTSTTAQAQADNLYTLDTAQLSFTGLAVGSEVRVYAGIDPATAVEVGGTEATGGSTFSLSHSVAGQAGYIVILAMGYQPVHIDYTFKPTDDSILIQPVVDRNYNNPV